MTVSVHKTGDIDEKSEIFFISIHLSMLSDSEVQLQTPTASCCPLIRTCWSQSSLSLQKDLKKKVSAPFCLATFSFKFEELLG